MDVRQRYTITSVLLGILILFLIWQLRLTDSPTVIIFRFFGNTTKWLARGNTSSPNTTKCVLNPNHMALRQLQWISNHSESKVSLPFYNLHDVEFPRVIALELHEESI